MTTALAGLCTQCACRTRSHEHQRRPRAQGRVRRTARPPGAPAARTGRNDNGAGSGGAGEQGPRGKPTLVEGSWLPRSGSAPDALKPAASGSAAAATAAARAAYFIVASLFRERRRALRRRTRRWTRWLAGEGARRGSAESKARGSRCAAAVLAAGAAAAALPRPRSLCSCWRFGGRLLKIGRKSRPEWDPDRLSPQNAVPAGLCRGHTF